MKKVLALMLALIMVMIIPVYGEQADDSLITDMVLDRFMPLTQIPRPSHHEEKIADYLEKWAQDRGFEVVRDEANNIIFDVPATEGMEDKPAVALQGHMDMVFAQKDGANLDKLTTVINVVNDGTYLRSDGNTSLGADDGIGVAIILGVADGEMAHGPVRVIVTTDEEDGMLGTFALDPKYVQEVSYLINIDSEQEGEMTVTTAAGEVMEFSGDVTSAEPLYNTAVTVRLAGLAGGHSGIDIKNGGLNGAIVMGNLLDTILKGGVDFELQSFNAGTAPNAIVTSATAVICTDEAGADKAKEICGNFEKDFLEKHKDTDPDYTLDVSTGSVSGKVMSGADRDKLIYFITNIFNGVNTWSAYIDGLVESSSNLGIVNVDADGIAVTSNIRSSSDERFEELIEGQRELGESLGMNIVSSKTADPWPYKEDNKLIKLAQDAYRKLFNEDIKEVAVHAGLECGTYAVYNKDINMISIGPTIHNPHTVNERLEIATIPKVWKLLEEMLANV